jgi:uncharacterized protein
MPRVTHFHISGTIPESLIPFYESLFEWRFERTPTPSPTWLIMTDHGEKPGIDGVLHTRTRDNRVVNTIEVDDIEIFVSRIESAGGRILERNEIPQVGTLVLFEDPEQNLFQLRQPSLP